jgi:DNA primase
LPVWCALGASRMHRVVFPSLVRKIVVFADNDDAGRAAAERTANVQRHHGRHVEIRWPTRGADFNEELILQANND